MMTVPMLSFFHSAANRRPTTRSHEAQHDAGDDVAGEHDEDGAQHAGEASTESLKSSLVTLPSISRPTYIRAGAVA